MARILVVDDEWMNRELMEGYLQAEGYEVTLANSAEAALETLVETPPDLILADVRMPGTDGLAFTRAVREDPRTQGIPVMLVTALASDEAFRAAFEAGAEDVLVRPVNATLLYGKLKTLLRLARLNTALRRLPRVLANHVDTDTAQAVLNDL